MPRARKMGPANNNRTDVIPKPMIEPVGQPNGRVGLDIATGMPYGMRQELEQMQRAVPLQNPGAIHSPTPPSGVTPPQATPGPPGDLSQAIQDAQSMPATGPGLLKAPTQAPGEPLTAGLPTGPGPGPEALPQWAGSVPTTQTAATATLGRLASMPNASKDIQVLANFAKQATQ